MFVKVDCILLLKLKKQNYTLFRVIFCAPYRNKMTSS